MVASDERPPDPVRAPESPTPAVARVEVYPVDGATQSVVTLACRVGTDASAVAVVAAWLRSTLWKELRTDAGQTYGVTATVRHVEHGAELNLETRVPNAVAAQTVELLQTRIRSADEVDELALDRWKLATAREMALDLQSTEQVVQRLAEGAMDGEGLSALTGRAERLAAVDLAAVRAALEPCAGHEIVTVVGPGTVGVDLRERGIEAEDISWRPVEIPATGTR